VDPKENIASNSPSVIVSDSWDIVEVFTGRYKATHVCMFLFPIVA
jgi:hypothetical protein